MLERTVIRFMICRNLCSVSLLLASLSVVLGAYASYKHDHAYTKGIIKEPTERKPSLTHPSVPLGKEWVNVKLYLPAAMHY